MNNGLTQEAQELIDAMDNYSPLYSESLRQTLEGKSGLSMRQAIGFIYGVHFGQARFVMSLPEWLGFWFVDDDNNISVITHDDQISYEPWFGDYQSRNDWNVIYRDNAIEQRIRTAKGNG